MSGSRLRVLHAFNQHRGRGGAENAVRATIEVSRNHGLQIEIFTRSSEDLPGTLAGRVQAGLSAIYAPGSARDFTALLESYQPHLVHIHEVFPLVSPWILPPCTARAIPVVMTCVDYRLTCPVVTHLYRGQICNACSGGREYQAALKNCRESLPESITVTLYNSMVRKLGLFREHVTRFIAPSEFSRRWLIEHGPIPEDRIGTVSPVVDIPETAADASEGTYVAYAGRFTEEKGLHVLLEAARLTELPFRLARNVRSHSTMTIPPYVQAETTTGKEDLDRFYRGARMLVFPSIWFETFGLVGAEALSHGIPVVASRIGALACLIEDGVDGLLFEPGDANDLAAKVRYLWARPELCRKMGQAGRQKAARLWNADRHFERLMEMYEQARSNLRAMAVAE